MKNKCPNCGCEFAEAVLSESLDVDSPPPSITMNARSIIAELRELFDEAEERMQACGIKGDHIKASRFGGERDGIAGALRIIESRIENTECDLCSRIIGQEEHSVIGPLLLAYHTKCIERVTKGLPV